MVRYDKKDRSLAGRGKQSVSSKVVPKNIPVGAVVKGVAANHSLVSTNHCAFRSLRRYLGSSAQRTQYRSEDDDSPNDDERDNDDCDDKCEDDKSKCEDDKSDDEERDPCVESDGDDKSETDESNESDGEDYDPCNKDGRENDNDAGTYYECKYPITFWLAFWDDVFALTL